MILFNSFLCLHWKLCFETWAAYFSNTYSVLFYNIHYYVSFRLYFSWWGWLTVFFFRFSSYFQTELLSFVFSQTTKMLFKIQNKQKTFVRTILLFVIAFRTLHNCLRNIFFATLKLPLSYSCNRWEIQSRAWIHRNLFLV